MRIDLLDMGKTQFGECILITRGDRRILIDGAHAGDAVSITEQLQNLLKEQPPFKIDLLVVTHCHSDHIGCLPKLIKEGILEVANALVADERLGFAIEDDGQAPSDSLFSWEQKGLLAALMEEDMSDLPEDKLAELIADAAKWESNYKFMLKQLSNSGATVIRYRGLQNTRGIAELEEAFKDFGLKILGPSTNHVLLCAHALGIEAEANADAIQSLVTDDAAPTLLARAYKGMVSTAADAITDEEDATSPGAAKNNQSIVISVTAEGWKGLLAGDMQFAKPDVKDLSEEMTQLLAAVNQNGPYDFIKLTHHTASNGLNEEIFGRWLNDTTLYAHSGGLNDPKHPAPKVLEILKAHRGKFTLARTDRNGIITVRKIEGIVQMEISKGSFNNFIQNVRLDEDQKLSENIPSVPAQPLSQIPELTQNFPSGQVTIPVQDDAVVQVTAIIPHKNTRVTITVDVDPEKKKSENLITQTSTRNADAIIVNDRFKNLLFITSSPLLSQNIGNSECTSLIQAIKKIPGALVIDIPASISNAGEAAGLVKLNFKPHIKGIVIIGGYDVVPGLQLDVLDTETRQQLEAVNKVGNDADDFIVWSDDIYGDIDGDFLPELPVSRIPDGKSSTLVMNAFNVSIFQPGNRFGLRNIARPFANLIYDIVPGDKNAMEISEKFRPNDIRSESLYGAVYLMLHGSDSDGTRLWGETSARRAYEAMNINNVPTAAPGTIIFAGACWGALTVDNLAHNTIPRSKISPRTAKNSIALTFLQNGAIAFVGCTGSHYSPLNAPYDFYGKPMHDNFWTGIGKGLAPAKALFEAKMTYLQNIPHRRKDLISRAVELKLFRAFTCLGIGW